MIHTRHVKTCSEYAQAMSVHATLHTIVCHIKAAYTKQKWSISDRVMALKSLVCVKECASIDGRLAYFAINFAHVQANHVATVK